MDAHQQDPGPGTTGEQLEQFLAQYPPFDAFDAATVAAAAAAAKTLHFAAGQVIVDAFTHPTEEMYVVLSGAVDIWSDPDRVNVAADERIATGGVFGYSAMLTEEPVGPRVVAAGPTTVVRIPADVVTPAFSTPPGARFLAGQTPPANRGTAGLPTYSLVEDLIVSPPLVVDASASVAEIARRITEHGQGYAAVSLPDDSFGLITDAVLRRRVLVEGLPGDTPAQDVMQHPVATARIGDSAAEALIQLLDHDADVLLVVDRSGSLRGAICPRDFAISPTTAGVAMHEQIRRVASTDELVERARRVPSMLADILSGGLASAKVIAVYSAIVDTMVRRAIGLVFAEHDELSVDRFTWLSLGSNGRREAVLGSDVDSAVAFDDSIEAREIPLYRAAFGQVNALLTDAGIPLDAHGAVAQSAAFSRTNSDWRTAGADWVAHPERNQGAILTSLLVDGRPIHGDPGLPEVVKVFGDLRRHPATMRMLLQESLAPRARMHTMKDVLTRRTEAFDIKAHAILPVVNIGRWAALGVGSAELATVHRLRAAAGSEMLPTEHADTLIEVFEVLQRVRLRYQLAQWHRRVRPSDLLEHDHLSPIDRSIVAQAVREIAATQKRMGNVSAYVAEEDWLRPS